MGTRGLLPIVRLGANEIGVAARVVNAHVAEEGRCRLDGADYPCWMARWGLAVYDRYGLTPPGAAEAKQAAEAKRERAGGGVPGWDREPWRDCELSASASVGRSAEKLNLYLPRE